MGLADEEDATIEGPAAGGAAAVVVGEGAGDWRFEAPRMESCGGGGCLPCTPGPCCPELVVASSGGALLGGG